MGQFTGKTEVGDLQKNTNIYVEKVRSWYGGMKELGEEGVKRGKDDGLQGVVMKRAEKIEILGSNDGGAQEVANRVEADSISRNTSVGKTGRRIHLEGKVLQVESFDSEEEEKAKKVGSRELRAKDKLEMVEIAREEVKRLGMDTERKNISELGFCRRFYVDMGRRIYAEKGCRQWACEWCKAKGKRIMAFATGEDVELWATWVGEFIRMVEASDNWKRGGVGGERQLEVGNVEQERVFANLGGYPTSRRLQSYRRHLDMETEIGIVEKWFCSSGIKVGAHVMGKDLKEAMRTLYTWSDLFTTELGDRPMTDLVQHRIPTWGYHIPVRARERLFTLEEDRWMKEKIPKMVDAGILEYSASDWCHHTKFVQKKDKGLRMVHVFCPINNVTINHSYPMKRIEPVINNLMQAKYRVYLQTDAANGFWAVPLYLADAHKTAFRTSIGQFHYLRMGQGLSGALQTYARLKDFFAGPIPGPYPQPSLDNSSEGAFEYFVDDDFAAHSSIKWQLDFMHFHYFPRLKWARLILKPTKSGFLLNSIEALGFRSEGKGLRPSLDKVQAIRDYPVPSNQEELERFIYMTTYLRHFIPGRSDHARVLKQAIIYGNEAGLGNLADSGNRMEEETVMKRKKLPGQRARGKKVKLKPVGFCWTESQQCSLDHIKRSIIDNAVYGGDEAKQYHLATDASKFAIGGVLFQIMNHLPGTVISARTRRDQRIIMFISKIFTPPGTRYSTTEREALAVVRCLEEVRWLILGSPYPTKVYTDHVVLVSLLKKDEAHGRIARWQVRLSEYDLEFVHIPGHENILADGLSRIPSCTSANNLQSTMSTKQAKFPSCDIFLVRSEEGKRLKQIRRGLEDWKEWLAEDWYAPIVYYKLTGSLFGLESTVEWSRSRNVRRVLRRSFRNFQLVPISEFTGKWQLLYRERNGELSVCVRKGGVSVVLEHLHDCHGHFAAGILIKMIVGRYFWPTRIKDIHYYCRTCVNCQLVGPLRPSAGLLPIVQLQPLDMLGIDIIGPVTPITINTGYRYIVIAVDYFTRFAFALPVTSATGESALRLLDDQVVRPFGWPRSIYTDNGQHFVNGIFPKALQQNLVRHFPAPKTHPSSVGLSETYVQILMTMLRTTVQDKKGSVESWDLFIPGIVHSMNTRTLRIHGYTPAELLFGFNPRGGILSRTITPRDHVVTSVLAAALQEDSLQFKFSDPDFIRTIDYNSRIARLDEQRAKALEQFASDADFREITQGVWEPLENGNLVLLRRFEVDRHKGRKLDAQWEGPYVLTDLSWHRRSGRLQDIQTGEIVRLRKGGLKERCHVNDLKLFVWRDYGKLGRSDGLRGIHGIVSNGKVKAQEEGVQGRRSLKEEGKGGRGTLVDLVEWADQAQGVAVHELCNLTTGVNGIL